MSTEVYEQILIVKQRLREKRKIEAAWSEVLRQQNEAETTRVLYQDRVNCEWEDVQKLEAPGLIGLFYAVLGNKDERLKQERQEHLEATLKYDEAVHTLESLEVRLNQIKRELEPYGKVESEYKRLCEESRQLILSEASSAREKLFEVDQRLVELKADRKEIEEAIAAGNDAARVLEKGLEVLGSAKNWGTFDLLGGGMLATMAKHSKIETANELIRLAQHHLLRFQQELAQADKRLRLSVEIEGFSKFADFFF